MNISCSCVGELCCGNPCTLSVHIEAYIMSYVIAYERTRKRQPDDQFWGDLIRYRGRECRMVIVRKEVTLRYTNFFLGEWNLLRGYFENIKMNILCCQASIVYTACFKKIHPFSMFIHTETGWMFLKHPVFISQSYLEEALVSPPRLTLPVG